MLSCFSLWRPHRATAPAPSGQAAASRTAQGESSIFTPSTRRYEDVAIVQNFFSDADGVPLATDHDGATFLEMGGYDGAVASGYVYPSAVPEPKLNPALTATPTLGTTAPWSPPRGSSSTALAGEACSSKLLPCRSSSCYATGPRASTCGWRLARNPAPSCCRGTGRQAAPSTCAALTSLEPTPFTSSPAT